MCESDEKMKIFCKMCGGAGGGHASLSREW